MSVHIYRPSSTKFIARVRYAGHRNYILVGRPTRSYAVAVQRMAREFAKGGYKRADVIMTADYYDPTVVCRMSKP